MLVSTKGRYALRVMIDLAEHPNDVFIPLKEIADRQQISEKYLESIISVLSKSGLVKGVRGKGGGYKLSKPPVEYTAADIISLTDGSLAPVNCLESGENTCKLRFNCKTLPMWKKLDQTISTYLHSVTLEDLVKGDV